MIDALKMGKELQELRLKPVLAPDANATGTEYISDVIGAKTDTTAGNSIVALVKQVLATSGAVDENVAGTPTCLPANAGFKALTSDATAWTHGTKVVIDADVASDVIVDGITIDAISAAAQVNVNIYTGAENSEKLVAIIPSAYTATKNAGGFIPCAKFLIADGSRITASLSDSTSSAQTASIVIHCHTV